DLRLVFGRAQVELKAAEAQDFFAPSANGGCGFRLRLLRRRLFHRNVDRLFLATRTPRALTATFATSLIAPSASPTLVTYSSAGPLATTAAAGTTRTFSPRARRRRLHRRLRLGHDRLGRLVVQFRFDDDALHAAEEAALLENDV